MENIKTAKEQVAVFMGKALSKIVSTLLLVLDNLTMRKYKL